VTTLIDQDPALTIVKDIHDDAERPGGYEPGGPTPAR